MHKTDGAIFPHTNTHFIRQGGNVPVVDHSLVGVIVLLAAGAVPTSVTDRQQRLGQNHGVSVTGSWDKKNASLALVVLSCLSYS